MKGPTLGPGEEDITWPSQVAPRGRKASSTRKIKPQTSNPYPVSGPTPMPLIPNQHHRIQISALEMIEAILELCMKFVECIVFTLASAVTLHLLLSAASHRYIAFQNYSVIRSLS